MNNIPQHFITNDITTINFIQESDSPSTLVILSYEGVKRMTTQLEGYSSDDFSNFSFSLTEENLKIENGELGADFFEAIVRQNLNALVRNAKVPLKNTVFGTRLYSASVSGNCIAYVLNSTGTWMAPYDFDGTLMQTEYHIDRGRTVRLQAFEALESRVDIYCF